MVKISIEAGTPAEALADLRRLARALASDAVETPIPTTGKAPETALAIDDAAVSTEPATVPTPAPVPDPTPVPPAAVQTTETPASPEAVATSPTPGPTAGPSDLPSKPPTAAPEPPPGPAITFDMLATAGSDLIDQGKMDDVLALLKRYGVQAITQLQESTYPAFAADLRALGAKI